MGVDENPNEVLKCEKVHKILQTILTIAPIRALSQIHGKKTIIKPIPNDLIKTLTFPKSTGASVYFPVLENCIPQSYVIELTNVWIC